MHWQDGRAAAGEQWSNGGGTAAAAAASAVLDCCVDEQSQISEEVEFGIKSISHQKGKYETKELNHWQKANAAPPANYTYYTPREHNC
jgi:hypothetical protein